MASFLDVVRFTAVSSGTGDFVVSALVTGYQTPASAGAVTGAIYRYRAENAALTEWEIGYGAYTVGSTTLARTTVLFNSLGTTAKISFTAPPQVGIVALAEDLIFISPPQGRLTLQTAVPVMTTTQSAKTTIYYTPYVGNQIPIYDGTSFRNLTFAEISVATTDTAKNPAAIGASKVNDWYIWDDAGTTRLTHSVDWTSDSARNTTNTLTNGILLNTSAITNGPAALRGTYVGTTRSNASSQLDWIYGAVAASGTAGFLGVWNMYNRVSVATSVSDSTDSWTYAVAATWRAANGSATMRVTAVCGLIEDSLSAVYASLGNSSTGISGATGVGLNTTTSYNGVTAYFSNANASGVVGSAPSSYVGLPTLGVFFVSANEFREAGTMTFFGDGGQPTYIQSGLTFLWRN